MAFGQGHPLVCTIHDETLETHTKFVESSQLATKKCKQKWFGGKWKKKTHKITKKTQNGFGER